jgi:lysozyme family protein
MTAANFTACMPLLFQSEGGYVANPRDPGGATNLGITIATLRAYRGAEVTAVDVRSLTRDEATLIYRQNYWSPIKGDLLPAGVDYAVFDFAVNSGPRKAAEALQACLSVTVDGDIGPVTWRAAAQVRAADVVNALCDRRLAYLRSLGTWAEFGAGWSARVARVRKSALMMADGAIQPVAAKPPPPLTPRQPDDPGSQPRPSPQPASSGLSHVPVAAAGAAGGLVVAATTGVSMSTIIAFVVGVAVGLVIPYLGRIKAAVTADPTASRAPTTQPSSPVQARPVQAVPPSQPVGNTGIVPPNKGL